MVLDHTKIPIRQKLILSGLYLSKYDRAGLKKLGFESFTEAFNLIGYALGQRPASIKNYRDEFDPFFPNKRKGWHKRAARDYCVQVLEDYKGLDLENFASLVRSFTGYDENAWSEIESKADRKVDTESFAKRLLTGVSAENYFISIHPTLPEFRGCSFENTTRLGCGYDFKLHRQADREFIAVEVKGLKYRAGGLSLTPKEYQVAAKLKERFFLFVVKNFSESPFHEIYQNPLATHLRFTRTERVVIHVSWLTSV